MNLTILTMMRWRNRRIGDERMTTTWMVTVVTNTTEVVDDEMMRVGVTDDRRSVVNHAGGGSGAEGMKPMFLTSLVSAIIWMHHAGFSTYIKT